ncbi:MAG: M20 family peptidase [Deltaproteobacteria bacterium]|nr:MAG: M20 family peptidase [Deltaproteobacteria bacterium]
MSQLPGLQQALASINHERLEQRLIDLVDIYSPSYAEGPILRYLEEECMERGMGYYKQPVDDSFYNLILTLGSGTPDFFILGHVDTIPQNHIQDHAARREEGIVRGLGAADMKSGVAAMVEALFALKDAGYPHDAPAIGVALLVDEEDGGTGIEQFVKRYQPGMAIVGEPTGMALCNIHYSYMELILSTKGKRVHSALAERGQNAILDLMQVIQRLYGMKAPGNTGGPNRCVFNLRDMHSGNRDFVVPPECNAWLDIHLHPDLSVPAFREAVEEILTQWQSETHKAHLTYEWRMSFSGFAIQDDEPIQTLLSQAAQSVQLEEQGSVFRSHSDANLLAEHGTRCVVIGPGELETAHTDEEYVKLSDLHKAAKLYVASFLSYASQS